MTNHPRPLPKGGETMKCPYCNQDMQKGYITSDARFLAWREEKHESANVKKGDGVQLAKKVFGGAATVSDYAKTETYAV